MRRPIRSPSRPVRVAMLAYPDVQILDVMGPLEVFSRTARWLVDTGRRADEPYAVDVIAPARGLVTASNGIAFRADHDLRRPGPPIDTLLVAGGRGTGAALGVPAIRRFLRAQAGRVRRLGAVCTGAFLLADAGLLDGRAATTHWAACDALARRFPRVRVEPDRIFVRDGTVYTSAGVTAGMDLALALVEEDLGREVALGVARELVLYLRRPGGQAQFSAQLAVQFAEKEPLRDLQAFILEHPERDLSVETLARRAAMSPRTFARHFTHQVGTRPARFVTAARVETARRRLEESHDSLESICRATGFGSLESMRRAFLKTVGVAPGQYRDRFTHRRSS